LKYFPNQDCVNIILMQCSIYFNVPICASNQRRPELPLPIAEAAAGIIVQEHVQEIFDDHPVKE